MGLPLEVDVLLDYSTMKSSLTSMVSEVGKSFKDIQSSTFDWKNIQDQFDPERIKTALGLKSLKTKIPLSDIIGSVDDPKLKEKLGGGGMLKALGLKDGKEKISIADLVNNEGAAKIMSESMGTMNWMPLVSKLFAPANLIAMFGAMAAMGITTALNQQAAGSSGAGSSGIINPATLPSGAQTSTPTSVGHTAGEILANTPDVGNISDMASALGDITAEVQKYGGSVQDGADVTQALASAAESTGESLSGTLQPVLSLIQSSGAKTSGQMKQLIANLMLSAQASGGTQTMGSIATKMDDFATNATKANVSFDAINQSIVKFGAESGINIQGANNDVAVLTDQLSGSTTGMKTLAATGNTFNGLVSSLNSNASTTFDSLNTKMSKMDASTASTVASYEGLPPNISATAAPLVKMASLTDSVASKTATLGDAVGTINAQLGATSNVNRQWNTFIDETKNGLADVANFMAITLPNAIGGGVGGAIKDLMTLTGTWVTDLENNPIIKTIGALATDAGGAIASIMSGGVPTKTSDNTPSNAPTSNKNANVTQNITVNNNGGSSSASSVLKSALNGAESLVGWL